MLTGNDWWWRTGWAPLLPSNNEFAVTNIIECSIIVLLGDKQFT